jgi:signal transduction histidine kinase
MTAHLPTQTTLDATRIGRCDPDVETAVYYTCVEAVQNAVKHCDPQAKVAISLRERRGRLCFEVRDTGPGFNLATARRSGGLVNMRDRIGAAGGRLAIRSEPGHQTVIQGSVPIGRRHR